MYTVKKNVYFRGNVCILFDRISLYDEIPLFTDIFCILHLQIIACISVSHKCSVFSQSNVSFNIKCYLILWIIPVKIGDIFGNHKSFSQRIVITIEHR